MRLHDRFVHHGLLTLLLALLTACRLPAVTRTPVQGVTSKPSRAASPAAGPTSVTSGGSGATGSAASAGTDVRGLAPLPQGFPTRVVAQGGASLTVSGVVRILAERGAGILSNNGVTLVSDAGGSLIGNNGAALVSNNGGGLVSNNGAGLISKTKPYRLAPYVLLADAPLAEAPLRDAGVYVTDAAGAVLTDEQGRPVGAVSDGEGRYTLRAQLPSENLVLRIPLRQGGALASVLVQSEKTAREVPIDTAATLASVYVLDRYVQKRAGVFNKLREAEATQLRDSLASTVVSLTSIPEYQTQAVVETTSSLRRSSPAVDQLLETIKVLLLGQERLGEGLPALEVPLAGPSALVDDGAGGFLIAEERPGRLRQVSAAGVLTTYMDRMQGRYKFNMGAISDVFRTSEGALYLAGTQTQGHGVHRLSPDGTLTQLVGTQARGRSTVGASALASEACPESLWVDRDGTLWFGEDGKVAGGVRVLSVGADGIVREPAPALPAWGDAKVVGLVRGSDGALYALIGITGAKGQIARLAPGETQWKKFAEVEETGSFGDLANAPDGGLWVALDRSGRLLWLGLDKKRRVVLDRAANSPIGKPCDLLPQPDGSVLVIDADTSLVHRVTREGQTSLLAGLDPKRPFDPAKGVALNVPQGLALDAQGRLLIAEMGGNAVQAWKDGNLTRLSGGVMGGTTATQTLDLARFNGPNALLARNGLLYVVDRLNFAVRVIDEAAGEVRVLAKNSAPVPMRLSAGQTLAPNAVNLLDCFGFTAASQGPFYFSAVYRNQVVRLQETGQAQLLAGSGEKGDAGDGGPADQAQLERPGGLGVTPQGDLLITDVGNFRVRRVLQPQGNAPRIEAFMGVPLAQSIGRLSASYAGADEGKPATEVAMAAPAALCYDPEGNLYVAELGTVYSHALFNLPGGAPLIDFSTLPVVPARIRRVDREGRVTTLVGPGGRFLTDPTAVDALVLPTSLLVDGQGRLVVADAGANLVRFFPLRAIP